MSESDVVIRVEGLGKKYALRHGTRERYTALRDVVARQAKAAGRLLNPFTLAGQLRKAAGERTESEEEFWALKDVNFEIRRGERLGIIGRNGTGKSTLLKILSRITEPTTGRVEICGRVASLLEVGTGFHPELTGRENIYLNGAILGMTRWEIRSKFDEIVDFAEVEKFLDTPVKRYSSGMYVRLAFAVAAHLEPEVLVVDEVLAVGDAGFQKKCLGKMGEISERQGRTVILVSHQMNTISHLCSSCLLLKDGRLSRQGSNVDEIIADYMEAPAGQDNPEATWEEKPGDNAHKNSYFWPQQVHLTTDPSTLAPCRNGILRRDKPIHLVIKAKIEESNPLLTIGYDLFNDEGSLIYRSYQTDSREEGWPRLPPTEVVLVSELPPFLNEGRYQISLRGGLHCRHWLFSPGKSSPSIYFSIQGGLSDSPYWQEKRPGVVAPLIQWKVQA